MDGFAILLGLAALAWICLGPILFFVQSSRITSLTDELHRLRKELDKRSASQLSRADGLAAELRRLSEQDRIQRAYASEDPCSALQPEAAHQEAALSPVVPLHARPPQQPLQEKSTPVTVASEATPPLNFVPGFPQEAIEDINPWITDTADMVRERLASRQGAAADRPGLELEPVDSPSPARRRPAAPSVPEPNWLNEMDAMQWMSWVGAVLVMIGAGFGLKYAIEEQYLGPTGRVALGILGGVATFVGAAYAMKKDYRVLAEGLAGAAMGILYFSFFAGFQWYELMPQLVAFVGMIVVTAVGLSFAGVFNSLPAAVLAMIGGFLTPYMLSRGGGNLSALFSYILILDLGVLCLATFRSWGRLHLLNFGGTLLIWIGWLEGRYQPEELWLTVAWITLFAVVFSLMGLWRHVIRKEDSSTPDMALMLMTPIAYFGALYGLTKAGYSDWHGIMALLVAAYYLGLGVFAFVRNPGNNQIVVTLVGVGLSFVTLAVPLQLTGHWIVIAWAIESLLLIEIGLRYEKPGFRLTGFGLLAIVQMHMVMYAGGTLTGPEDFTTGFVRKLWEDPATAATGKSALGGVINGRSMSFLANAIVLAILAWEYRRREKSARIEGVDENWKKLGIGGRVPDAGQISTILIPLVPVIVLAMGLLETFVFGVRAHWSVATHLSMLPIWLSLLAVASVLAFRRMADVETLGALAKFLYWVTGCLFLIFLLMPFPDWGTADASMWGQVIFNPRGFGFLTAIGATLVGAIQFSKNDPADTEGRSIGNMLMIAVPLVLLGMSLTETFAFGQRYDWLWATQMSQVGFWFSLFSVGTLIASQWLGNSGSLSMLTKWFYIGTIGLLFLLLVTTLSDTVLHGQTVLAEAYSRPLLNPRGLCLLIGAGATLFGAIQFTRSEPADNKGRSIGEVLTTAVPLVLLGMCLNETSAFGQRHSWLWATQLSQVTGWFAIFSVGTLIAARWLGNSGALSMLSRLIYIGTGGLLLLLMATGFGDIVQHGQTVVAEAYSRVLLNPRGLCLVGGAISLLLGIYGQATSPNRDHNFVTALKLAAPIVLLSTCLLESYAFGQRRDWIWATFVSATGIGLASFAYLTRLVGHRFDIRQSPLTGLSQVFYVGLGAVIVILFFGTLGDWGGRVRGTLDAVWLTPFFNPRGVCFLLAIGSAWAGRSLVTKEGESDDREYLIPTQGGLSLGLFAYLIAFLMCTIEVFAFGKQHSWGTATALAITGTWALMAITTTGVGLIKRSSPIRMLAIGLFALTTAKVFLYDVWYLHKTIRWAAFIGLGVTLFATSFLYRRFREQLKDWIKPMCLLLATTLALGIGVNARAEEAEPDLSTQFSHRFELETFDPKLVNAEADPNFVRIPLTPEIYDASQRNLDDLRLLSVDEKGVSTQIPYILISPTDEFGQADQNLPIVSRQDIADSTEFVVSAKEINEPVESLRLSVTSPEREYVRSLRLYGANQTDDGAWKLLVNDGYLVDRTRGSLHLTESTIPCPRSQFRYYRIVIENEGQAPLTITGCTARMVRRRAAPRVSYPLLVTNEVRTDRQITRSDMTLAGPVPIDRIEIEIAGVDEYHRHAQLLTVQATSTSPITNVQLFHLAKVSHGHTANVVFTPQQAKRLRLEIQNGDDRPLTVTSAKAYGIERSLAVPVKSLSAAANPVVLYVGGQVSSPSYDLARISTVPDVEHLTTLAVLSGAKNPTYREVSPPLPWAEDHRTLVWVMVLGGVVVLSVLAVTLLKAAAAQQPTVESSETTSLR